MKIRTKIITCLLVIGSIISGFAQSDHIMKQADKLVINMNEDIVGQDKSSALSDAQKSKIKTLQVDRLEALAKIRKDGGSEEDKKATNKACYQKIYKDILSQKQRLAMKEANEKKKKK
ncbi:hypothetical protein SAMN06265371_11328 [Lutibacter agarilyticus]|uniref:LTXXQ motif family protein n=1 Tax=Lutibacter agarilyticus TaxID=1109740 RepID=A0A238Z658_9FLAO|nr:hypothetical protein [Lutibacter agarilyticus]SNR78264.1 hypothetical protein SAMN06265371_11328 [Lutibacter agarilyticus]